MKTSHYGLQRQIGFSLIEALIAMLVVALALLGHLTLQQKTIRNQQVAHTQALATNLINDLSERIVANSAAASEYDTGFISSYAASGKDCSSAGASCSSAQLADYDLDIWFKRASHLLPNVILRISDPYPPAAGRSNQVQITLGWNVQRNSEAIEDCDSPSAKCVTLVRVF